MFLIDYVEPVLTVKLIFSFSSYLCLKFFFFISPFTFFLFCSVLFFTFPITLCHFPFLYFSSFLSFHFYALIPLLLFVSHHLSISGYFSTFLCMLILLRPLSFVRLFVNLLVPHSLFPSVFLFICFVSLSVHS